MPGCRVFLNFRQAPVMVSVGGRRAEGSIRSKVASKEYFFVWDGALHTNLKEAVVWQGGSEIPFSGIAQDLSCYDMSQHVSL